MDEADKIKAFKSEQEQKQKQGGGCLYLLILALTITSILKGLVIYALITQPQPEAVATPIPQHLVHQRQTAVVMVTDNRQIQRVGYEYHDNAETVTSWECGYQQAICSWYTPNIPPNRQLFVVVEFSDGGLGRYGFNAAMDLFEINAYNRPVKEILP